MFEAQRSAIEQSQQAIESGIRLQRNAGRVALTGLKTQASVQQQGLEIARTAAQGSLDAAAAPVQQATASDGRRAVDDQFTQVRRAHAEVFDALEGMLRRSVDSYDELSGDYLDTLDEQVDEFLALHDEVQAQVAEDFEEYAEEFGHQLEEQLERTEEIQERFEAQLERQNEQAGQLLERQAEQIEQLQEELAEQAIVLQDQLTDQFEDAQQSASEQAPDAEPEDALDQLEAIEGIDADEAERLRAAGYETPEAVAGANPDELADAADVAQARAREWIEHAQLP